ncbi:MAG: hypothetical protein KKC46_13680 [Proteobacteria bacterium]|nr:hypothetical protein [Pseudomonadota bacterium]
MNAKRIAYHEAGHALIGWYYGFRIGKVTINPPLEIAQKDGVSGLCEMFPFFSGHTELVAKEDLLSAEKVYFGIAGRVADDLFYPKESFASGKDFENIVQMLPSNKITLQMHEFDLKKNSIEDFYRRFKNPVAKIMRSRKGKKALKALSSSLLRAGTISGAEAVSILEKAWGKPAPVKSKPSEDHMSITSKGPKTYNDALRSLEAFLAIMLRDINHVRFDLEDHEQNHINNIRHFLLISKEILKNKPDTSHAQTK